MSEAKKIQIDASKLKRVVATDCGSTTTKAILFEKTTEGWRQTYRGEAPTTVEKPVADVTIGAVNAFSELEEISKTKILKDNPHPDECPILLRKKESEEGVDLYVSTSSAGGGLQMVVAGAVSSITTESAERAALGAGAIVMDSISIDDGRESFERVKKIRHLRPDIVLLSGGIDGGNKTLPLELAEMVLQADPRPRFGETLRLPVIYAGNKESSEDAKEILSEHFEYVPVENLRPNLEKENLAPARDAVHELFLHHVMSHAPGYDKLLKWSPVPIIPTPSGFGNMAKTAAERENINIVAVDIGGATTDVFSIIHQGDEAVYNRTVSANLGMSYSVANVLLEAGEGAISKWLPYILGENKLRDRLRNKMIRPTTIPQTIEDLILEQAVCREALRLAFAHHKKLAVGLTGKKQSVSVSDALKREVKDDSIINMLELDMLIGSGGVLSHAPNRRSTALMLIDAYEPTGVTRLAVDSIFMMPHLGVFATVHPEAATEIFVKDCLINLGTVVAPQINLKPGAELFKVKLASGESETLKQGQFKRIALDENKTVEAEITPLSRKVDVGAGAGKTLKAKLHGGEAGIILDGRGRKLQIADTHEQRIKEVQSWYDELVIERGHR